MMLRELQVYSLRSVSHKERLEDLSGTSALFLFYTRRFPGPSTGARYRSCDPRPIHLSIFVQPLKVELQSELNQTRISSFRYSTESAARGRTVGEISVGSKKLSMVPGVKELRAELGVDLFPDGCLFQNREVRLTDCWTTTVGARSVPDHSTRISRCGISARVAWERRTINIRIRGKRIGEHAGIEKRVAWVLLRIHP